MTGWVKRGKRKIVAKFQEGSVRDWIEITQNRAWFATVSSVMNSRNWLSNNLPIYFHSVNKIWFRSISSFKIQSFLFSLNKSNRATEEFSRKHNKRLFKESSKITQLERSLHSKWTAILSLTSQGDLSRIARLLSAPDWRHTCNQKE